MSFGKVYEGKTVFITGHTGFKGSWLCEWLLFMGAEVVGYSLDAPTEPSHFAALQLGDRLKADIRGDVRHLDTLQTALDEHDPDFIFHLAAQPLVRRAFDEPCYTVETNVVGSLNILEAVRRRNQDCIVIMITTDKVYENVEWVHAYRENDTLGGHDPYSASKVCAEILISSYQRSFFNDCQIAPDSPAIAIASVRGGNVIGGGDWAKDRIVPDSIRSLAGNESIPVRNRHATRPWQHVLELLSGYLHLGSEIYQALAAQNQERLTELCSPFNFGPRLASNRTVKELVEELLKHWSGDWEDLTETDAKHEASKLNLTIDKAYHTLGWQPQWTFEQTIEQIVEWYKGYYQAEQPNPALVQALTQRQILAYAEGLDYGTNDLVSSDASGAT